MNAVHIFVCAPLRRTGFPLCKDSSSRRDDCLTARLSGADSNVRWPAADALGKIGPAAVPMLTEALRDAESSVRWHAADALGKIGLAAVLGVMVIIALHLI
jgi:HEAT repeat protein